MDDFVRQRFEVGQATDDAKRCSGWVPKYEKMTQFFVSSPALYVWRGLGGLLHMPCGGSMPTSMTVPNIRRYGASDNIFLRLAVPTMVVHQRDSYFLVVLALLCNCQNQLLVKRGALFIPTA